MRDLFTSIVAVVSHTPYWVWLLYAGLMVLGLQRTRDNVLPFWRLLILPGAVVAMTVASAIGAGVGLLPVVLLGLLLGGTAGWCLEPVDSARRTPGGMIALRGEWWTLAQIVLVLLTRYAISVLSVTHPMLSVDTAWRVLTLLATTALSGALLGRIAVKIRAYSLRIA
jgi:hypothetical protein